VATPFGIVSRHGAQVPSGWQVFCAVKLQKIDTEQSSSQAITAPGTQPHLSVGGGGGSGQFSS
jgi:hypothetical protein